MKRINNIMKKDKAITLIALVVTIIILLILAGVAVGFATNETGLFDKAKFATDEYNNSVNEENNELNVLEQQIDMNSREISEVTKQQIEEYLNDKYKCFTFQVSKSGSGTNYFMYSNYFTVPDASQYKYFYTTYTVTTGGGFAETWFITPMKDRIYIYSNSGSSYGTLEVNVFYKKIDS